MPAIEDNVEQPVDIMHIAAMARRNKELETRRGESDWFIKLPIISARIIRADETPFVLNPHRLPDRKSLTSLRKIGRIPDIAS